MSKFIEFIESMHQQPYSNIGFRQGKQTQRTSPDLVLVGQTSFRLLENQNGIVKLKPDTFLVNKIPENANIKLIGNKLSKQIWGVKITEPTESQIKNLVETGCDYIVIESMETEASILNEVKIGKIVTLKFDLEEELIHAVSRLPIDAVILILPKSMKPMTLKDLVMIQRVLGTTDKPVILETSSEISHPQLEIIRNMGITGLITTIPPISKINRLRTAIDKLPERNIENDRRYAQLPYESSTSSIDPLDTEDISQDD